VERAKQLLGTPGRIKFHRVAKACGFSSVDRMRLVFQRVTGMTPSAFRLAEGSKGKP
jgi:transcriptional regulator GlxA family with amidase domain